MKGKYLVGVLTVVMVLTSVAVCFAGSGSIQPRYIATNRVTTNLSISGATANISTKVKPLDQNSLDSVAVTVNLINSGTKETVKTWSKTLSMTDANDFRCENSAKLTAKGKYYTKVVAKCYKSGKLIETISTESKVVTY